MTRKSKIVVALAIVAFAAIFATGCGGGGSDDDSALQRQIHRINTRLDMLESKDRQPTPVKPEKPKAATTTTTTESEAEKAFNMRNAYLEGLPYDQCIGIDAYDYLGFKDPRVLPSGAFFNYDCNTHYWGWYYQGASTDRWTPRQVPPSAFKGSQSDIELPLEAVNPPKDRRHPRHTDAITLGEMKVGETICTRDEPVRPGAPAFKRQYTVTRFFTSAYKTAANNVFAYAAIGTDPPVGVFKKGGDGVLALEDMGVIPFNNGLWSTAYVTAGPC